MCKSRTNYQDYRLLATYAAECAAEPSSVSAVRHRQLFNLPNTHNTHTHLLVPHWYPTQQSNIHTIHDYLIFNAHKAGELP